MSYFIKINVCFLWLLFVTALQVYADSEKTSIFFYSSDSNINNFKSLKIEYDSYFSRFGNYEFQPFSDRETFEAIIQNKTNCILILSSWHYANIYHKLSLVPILAGVRNNQIYQKRILMCSKEMTSLDFLKTGLVASSCSISYTQSILKGIFPNSADAFKILTVPKDIDALMSVGFGMSRSALSTDYSVEKLKQINPKLYDRMFVFAEGKTSLILLVAVPESFQNKSEEIIRFIQAMDADPHGKKNLSMIGLDGWKKLEPSHRTALEGKDF